jgi:N-acetylneuraminate synthase
MQSNKYKLDKAYIIAEIGINHNGSLDVVKKLIELAAIVGFDAVKFQKRNPDVCVPEAQKSKKRMTPWGEITYLEYKKRIEFEEEEYDQINSWCKRAGIEWSASPWDKDSVDFLAKYKLPWVKAPSAVINDADLLTYIGSKFDRVILSTGASDIHMVQAAHRVLERSGVKFIDILHCNSAYPSPVHDLHLNCIPPLAAKFPGSNVGYSGHEYGVMTTVATVALGAKIIERHVTLDKGMWGSDQKCSLEPHAMIKLVRAIRELEQALGGEEKIVTPLEIEKMKSLRKQK